MAGLLCCAAGAQAQTQIDPCGNDSWHTKRWSEDKSYREGILQANAIAEAWMAKNKQFMKDNSGKKIVIPVVFHVVYNLEAQKLPYERIVQQIETFNRDFNRYNHDRFKTRSVFDTVAGSCDVVFTLARKDPDGNPTTGVTYTQTSFKGFDLIPPNATYTRIDSLKSTSGGGHSAWPEKYLNLWVANLTYFGGTGLYGIATFPRTMPPGEVAGQAPTDVKFQGAALYYQTVGMNVGTSNDTTFAGRTAIHEVGHFLGLRHVWGDSQAQACDSSDYCFDTPQCKKNANFSCNFSVNECSNEDTYWGSVNPPNMVENFMDYSGDNCYNMFTKGQIGRMQGFLNTERKALWENNTGGGKDRNQFKAWGYTNAITACPQVCDGSIELIAQEGTSPYTYYVDGVQSSSNIYTNMCVGLHSVVVKDAAGDSIYFDLHVNKSKYKKPSYSKSSTAATCFTCPDGTAKVTLGTGTQPYTVTWNVNPPVTGNQLTGCKNGYYKFTIVDGCGMTYTDSVKVNSPSGIAELSAEAIQLFPNPANDQVNVQLSDAVVLKSVVIRNLVGSEIRRINLEGATKEVTVNIADLSNGVYVLELVDESNSAKAMKFVKN